MVVIQIHPLVLMVGKESQGIYIYIPSAPVIPFQEVWKDHKKPAQNTLSEGSKGALGYIEPNWPPFLKVNPPKQGLSSQD